MQYDPRQFNSRSSVNDNHTTTTNIGHNNDDDDDLLIVSGSGFSNANGFKTAATITTYVPAIEYIVEQKSFAELTEQTDDEDDEAQKLLKKYADGGGGPDEDDDDISEHNPWRCSTSGRHQQQSGLGSSSGSPLCSPSSPYVLRNYTNGKRTRRRKFLNFWQKYSTLVICLITVPLEIGLLFCFSYGWNYLFLVPFCGFLFRCGCTWVWSGGVNKCNVHTLVPQNEKCPWCTAPPTTMWLTVWGIPIMMTLMGVVFGRIIWHVYRKRQRRRRDLLLLHMNPMMGKHATTDTRLITSKKLLVWFNLIVVARLVVALLTFFLFGFLLALAFKIASGYPYFILGRWPEEGNHHYH